MPSALATRRALTTVVGAVFATLFIGAGALASPTAKTTPSPSEVTTQQGSTQQGSTLQGSTLQGLMQVQGRSAHAQFLSADDAQPVIGHTLSGPAATSNVATPDLAADPADALRTDGAGRRAPKPAGSADLSPSQIL